MKKILAAILATTAFLGTAAEAETCVELDYAEMKDMSQAELTKEYCTAVNRHSDLVSDIVRVVGRDGRDEELARYHKDADQCKNQRERIRRVMVRNGQNEESFKNNAVCTR
jgi:hypothetical protein